MGTFICVNRLIATPATKRASSRAGESFSPPTSCRVAIWAGVSVWGGPSAKSRTSKGSVLLSSPWEAPTMSLVNMPWMSTEAFL